MVTSKWSILALQGHLHLSTRNRQREENDSNYIGTGTPLLTILERPACTGRPLHRILQLYLWRVMMADVWVHYRCGHHPPEWGLDIGYVSAWDIVWSFYFVEGGCCFFDGSYSITLQLNHSWESGTAPIRSVFPRCEMLSPSSVSLFSCSDMTSFVAQLG